MSVTPPPRLRQWQRKVARLLNDRPVGEGVATRAHATAQALLGRPYVAHALVGSATVPERLVLDLDGFDCVTFVENVLALARARSVDDAMDQLVRLRYLQGRIAWTTRNHYFHDWLARNQRAGFVKLRSRGDGSRRITAQLASLDGLPQRTVQLHVVAKPALLKAAARMVDGSVVAFASTRARLDYFHVGLLFWEGDDDGEKLMLYHASRSQGGVVREPLTRFVQRNRMRGLACAAPREVAR